MSRHHPKSEVVLLWEASELSRSRQSVNVAGFRTSATVVVTTKHEENSPPLTKPIKVKPSEGGVQVLGPVVLWITGTEASDIFNAAYPLHDGGWCHTPPPNNQAELFQCSHGCYIPGQMKHFFIILVVNLSSVASVPVTNRTTGSSTSTLSSEATIQNAPLKRKATSRILVTQQ